MPNPPNSDNIGIMTGMKYSTLTKNGVEKKWVLYVTIPDKSDKS